jgi:hypothetical protein
VVSLTACFMGARCAGKAREAAAAGKGFSAHCGKSL